MVFLFGYDVPVVEVLVSLGALSIVTLILLLVSLHRSKEMNKKLDKLMGEEKQFKEALDAAKQEEDQQLALMRTMVKEMHVLEQINNDEHEGMAAVQRLAKRASRHVRDKNTHPELKNVLNELTAHIEQLDRVSSKENRQLQTINRIVSKVRR